MTTFATVLLAAALPELVSDNALMFFAAYSNLEEAVTEENTWDGHTNDLLRWNQHTASGFLANISGEIEREVFMDVDGHMRGCSNGVDGTEYILPLTTNFLKDVTSEESFLETVKNTNYHWRCLSWDSRFADVKRTLKLDEGAVKTNVFGRILKPLLDTSQNARQSFDWAFLSNDETLGGGSSTFTFVSTNAPSDMEDTRFPTFDWNTSPLAALSTNEWAYVWPQFSQFPTNGIVPIEHRDLYTLPGFGDYQFGNPPGRALTDFLDAVGSDPATLKGFGETLALMHVRLWEDESLTNHFVGTSISNTVHYGHATPRLDYTRQALEAHVYHLLDRRYVFNAMTPHVSNVVYVAEKDATLPEGIRLQLKGRLWNGEETDWRYSCAFESPVSVTLVSLDEEITPVSTAGYDRVFCEIGSTQLNAEATARAVFDPPFESRYHDVYPRLEDGVEYTMSYVRFSADGANFPKATIYYDGRDQTTGAPSDLTVTMYATQEPREAILYANARTATHSSEPRNNAKKYIALGDDDVSLCRYCTEVKWPFMMGRIDRAVLNCVFVKRIDIENAPEPTYMSDQGDCWGSSDCEEYAYAWVENACDYAVEGMEDICTSYPFYSTDDGPDLSACLKELCENVKGIYTDKSKCEMPPHILRKGAAATIEISLDGGRSWGRIGESDPYKLGKCNYSFDNFTNAVFGSPITVEIDMKWGADLRMKFKNLHEKEDQDE